MQCGPYEYKNVKRLRVVYPECDNKHEYEEPILCRARDMGKVIYGKWIIGGEQWGSFAQEPCADDDETFYKAYKLVGGAKIICNFELGAFHLPPFLTGHMQFHAGAEELRYYEVDEAINNYRPACGEPKTDVLENGLIYIKMPDDAGMEQTDDAAEEKFAGRPQIQIGDVVRYIAGETGKEVVEAVTCEIVEGASYTPAFSFNPFFNEIIAVYRFDGRDFKCIWESAGYTIDRFEDAFAEASTAIKNLRANVTSITAAVQLMERCVKEVKSKESR